MRDDNCIFCKIANGEIPAATLYEDEDFRVILDLGPATKGHALILPKNHFANLFEIPEDMDAKAFILAKKIAIKMKDVFYAATAEDAGKIGFRDDEMRKQFKDKVTFGRQITVCRKDAVDIMEAWKSKVDSSY